MITNSDLQPKYEQMHSVGPTAWFSNGNNERDAIMWAGILWGGLKVLEIGCGEGDLAARIADSSEHVYAIDYSDIALAKAEGKRSHNLQFANADYRKIRMTFDRVVMQGVIEHFTKPWEELDWIIRNLVKPGGDVITSSPCFLNPRGIIWMTLATLFDAPRSLTDLHFLHPWEFEKFAQDHPLIKDIDISYTDEGWAEGSDMVADLSQRLPKVFPEMGQNKIESLMTWLDKAKDSFGESAGATAVYRLRIKNA
jgi:ubiquinone/menaquinone biosynthesis C-methylase UbiE